MATVNKPNTFNSGTTALSAEVNSNFDTIYNEFNGNIDNSNIKASAAIVDTKLAQITTGGKVATTAITISGEAEGDILYQASTGTWTNLSAGTSGTFLQTNGASNAPSWNTVVPNIKIGKFTKALDDGGTATATSTITGVGFNPTNVIFNFFRSGQTMGMGMDDGSTSEYQAHGLGTSNFSFSNTSSIGVFNDNTFSNGQEGNISSFSNDGFVITWAVTGSATATNGQVTYMAFG